MWVGRITALYFESFSLSQVILPSEGCNTKTLVSQLYGIRIVGRFPPMKTRLKSSADFIQDTFLAVSTNGSIRWVKSRSLLY